MTAVDVSWVIRPFCGRSGNGGYSLSSVEAETRDGDPRTRGDCQTRYRSSLRLVPVAEDSDRIRIGGRGMSSSIR